MHAGRSAALLLGLAAAGVAAPASAGVSTAALDALTEDSPTAVGSAAGGFLLATVRPGHAVILHARPRGRVITRLRPRTEFGSRRVMWVAEATTDGRWLGVVTPARPNGKLGWIRARPSRLTLSHTRYWLAAELARREVVLHHGTEVVRRIPVAIGRRGTTTPRGHFAVTDKLPGAPQGAAYGCCIVALSAHQPQRPPGWKGSVRIAIHDTPWKETIGRSSSAGCLRARRADVRLLMARVPLGTPVFIRG